MSAELAEFAPLLWIFVAPLASTLVRLGRTSFGESDITTLGKGVDDKPATLETIRGFQFIQIPARARVLFRRHGHAVEIEDQTDPRSLQSKATIKIDGEDNGSAWHGTRNARTLTYEDIPLFQVVHDKAKQGNFGDPIRVFEGMQKI